uniref:Uncharacterized protein n=1 Tax=Meloidogyne floridensis TaxID=298350 RepID=A0A915NH84_9BILA
MENEVNRREQNSSSLNDSEFPTATDPLLKQPNNSSDQNATDGTLAHSGPIQMNGGHAIQSDRLNIVYMIFLLHGVGVLLPWNTFLTIGYDYFVSYKLNARIGIRLSASIYFGLALLTVIACGFSFRLLTKNKFYKFHVRKAVKSRATSCTDVLHEGEDICGNNSERKPSTPNPSLATYYAIFKESWRGLFNVWIIFFTTLAIFPSVLLKIELYPPGRTFDIFIYGDWTTSRMLFRQLTVFLNFNLFATIGSWIASYIQWPSTKSLTIPVVARLAFIPLFLACNYQTGTEPRNFVLIKDEWSFVILITFMSITHGYWSSLAMMYAPRQVDQSKSQIVGMMSGFFLVFGIASGIAFTFVEPHIVDLFGLLNPF